MTSQELSQIEQYILQIHQGAPTSPQIPSRTDQKYIGPQINSKHSLEESTRHQNQPLQLSNQEKYQIQQSLTKQKYHDLVNYVANIQKIVQSKIDAQGELQRQLVSQNRNINNKIQAIKNQITYNKDRIDKLRQNKYKTLAELQTLRDQQSVSVEDTKHYASKMLELQDELLGNSSLSGVRAKEMKFENVGRNKSSNKKRIEHKNEVILKHQSSKLKKTKAKPFKK